jgi:hypothetical protein
MALLLLLFPSGGSALSWLGLGFGSIWASLGLPQGNVNNWHFVA